MVAEQCISSVRYISQMAISVRLFVSPVLSYHSDSYPPNTGSLLPTEQGENFKKTSQPVGLCVMGSDILTVSVISEVCQSQPLTD